MKYKAFLLTAFTLIFNIISAKADESSFDPKWSECRIDSDCIEVKEGLLPVNKKYLNEMKKFSRQQNAGLDDVMPPRNHAQICLQNKCVTRNLN